MSDRTPWHFWAMRGLFVALSGYILFLQLLPVATSGSGWTAPDLLTCLVFVWVSRRPEYAPVILVAAVVVMADLLLNRPPGLLAALTILVTERFRRRRNKLHMQNVVLEWAYAGAGIAALYFLNRFALAILMTPNAPLLPSFSQLLSTILFFPAVLFLSSAVFGITRVSGAELEAGGQRV